MATAARVLGIDVSKQWLDVAIMPERTHWRVSNDAAGWAELCQQVQVQAPTWIMLDRAGGYELGVAVALEQAGFTPVLADPLQTRRFAQSRGQRAKTDRVDALLLAQFGAERHPEPLPLPSAAEREAHALLTRRRALTTMLVQEKNRRPRAIPTVQTSIEVVMTCLEHQRHAIDQELAAVVASDPALQARVALLMTVPGLAAYSATVLAVEVPHLGTRSTKQLASLLGVAPFACESGQRTGQRQISGGRRWVRHLLYEVTLTTIRQDPTFAAYYKRLREAPVPKPGKVARIACRRRLLGILHAMLRDGLTWQETEVGQGRFVPAAA